MIERWLGDALRLTKIRKRLVRQGVEIACPTLRRFAVLELQFEHEGDRRRGRTDKAGVVNGMCATQPRSEVKFLASEARP